MHVTCSVKAISARLDQKAIYKYSLFATENILTSNDRPIRKKQVHLISLKYLIGFSFQISQLFHAG